MDTLANRWRRPWAVLRCALRRCAYCWRRTPFPYQEEESAYSSWGAAPAIFQRCRLKSTRDASGHELSVGHRVFGGLHNRTIVFFFLFRTCSVQLISMLSSSVVLFYCHARSTRLVKRLIGQAGTIISWHFFKFRSYRIHASFPKDKIFWC